MSNTHEIHIDANQVAKVVHDAGMTLVGHRYHPAVVVTALAELLGRVIAAQDVGYVGHRELKSLANDHIINTLKAAYSAKGLNPEALQ